MRKEREKTFQKYQLKEKKKIAIFIGPVGGWSEDDRRSLNNLDFINVTLGNNILKVDTACIVSLSSIRNII